MKIKQQILKLLWEIPAVVIAVLLALGVNTWKESRSERSAATESLKAIISELAANEASILEFRNDNQAYLDQWQAVLDSMERNNITNIEDAQFDFSFRILSSAVWETSQTKEIAKYHNPNIVRDIAKLYNIQQLLDDIWHTQLNKISSLEFHRQESTKPMIAAHIQLLETAVAVANVYLESKKTLDPSFQKAIEK